MTRRMRRRGLDIGALLVCVALSGCGGAPDETVQDQDIAYQQAMDAGSQAFGIERYTVAERSYREAARLALRRNDAGAIGDSAYNLAVTQLSAGRPADALRTVQTARAALLMRSGQEALAGNGGLPNTPHHEDVAETGGDALTLIAAAAEYRLGQDAAAAREARLASRSSERDIALRGAFLSGLIAARDNDPVVLAGAIGLLQASKLPLSAAQSADLAELQALQAMATDPAGALSLSAKVVSLRRETGDYGAMARALALEADAARKMGQTARANDLLAQAAQSLGARAGTDSRPDTQAETYMREAGFPGPIQPFRAKETVN